jgi:hypothetical protein
MAAALGGIDSLVDFMSAVLACDPTPASDTSGRSHTEHPGNSINYSQPFIPGFHLEWRRVAVGFDHETNS